MGVSPMRVTLMMMVVIMMLVIKGTFAAMIVTPERMDFDLQGRMAYSEAFLEVLLRLGQEAVPRMAARHDQMRRHRRLRGADGPDMHMVDVGDARALRQ